MQNLETLASSRLTETCPIALVIQDLDGHIIQFNQKFVDLVGLTPDEIRSVKSDHWKRGVIDEFGKSLKYEEQPSAIALNSGKPVKDFMIRMTIPHTKEIKWVEIDSTPLLDSKGKVEAVITYFKDVAREKSLDEKLTFSAGMERFISRSFKVINSVEPNGTEQAFKKLAFLLEDVVSFQTLALKTNLSIYADGPAFWISSKSEINENQHQLIKKISDELELYSAKNANNEGYVLVPNVENWKPKNAIKENFVQRGVEAFLYFPIQINEKIIGSLYIECISGQNQMAKAHLNTLKIFSDLLGTFLSSQSNLWNLRETWKELNCIYKVTRKCSPAENSSPNFIQEALEEIPAGFLYPEDTLVELNAGGQKSSFGQVKGANPKSYQSPLNCPAIGETFLKVTISEGLTFLPEEKRMVDRLADIFQTEMQRRAFTARLETVNKRLSHIYESEQHYILRVSLDGIVNHYNRKYEDDFKWLFKTPEAMNGHHVIHTVMDYHHEKLEKAIAECLKSPGKFVNVQIDKPRESGVYNTFWEFVAVAGPQGHPVEIQCIGIDVSEVVQANRGLMRFKQIADQSSNGAIITSIKGKVEYCNEEICNILGFKQAELIGKEDYELFHSDFEENRQSINKELLEKGRINDRLIKAKFSTGLEAHILLNATIIEGSPENWVYYSFLDVTEKVSREEKLREGNQRMSAILNAIPDTMFIHDKDGNFLEVYTGVTNDDLSYMKGRNIRQYYTNEVSDKLMKLIHSSVENRAVGSIEISMNKGAETNWYDITVAPIDKNRVLRFVRDITLAKEHEEQLIRYNIAINQSPAGIVITDLEGTIEFASPSMQNCSGFSPDELIGVSSGIFSSGETPIETYKEMWSTIMAGDIWEGEILNKNRNGQNYWERLSISPIKNSDGELSRFMAIKQNIDKEKRYRMNLLKQNQIFKEIAYSQSHEVRAPLARIQGLIDLITTGDEYKPEILDALKCSSTDLDAIIRSIVAKTEVAKGLMS